MKENREPEETGLTKTSKAGSLATGQDKESIEDFRKRMEAFTARMNRAPEANKILTRTEGNETYDYLPISAVEHDLRKQFFGLVQFEILSYYHVLNEVVMTARIKVFHPVLMQWLNYDGVGAGVLQQDSKTPLIDFMQYKKKNAQKLGAPIAYAEAIKNAAKKIGKKFGSDLNRKHEDYYIPTYTNDPDTNNKPLN